MGTVALGQTTERLALRGKRVVGGIYIHQHVMAGCFAAVQLAEPLYTVGCTFALRDPIVEIRSSSQQSIKGTEMDGSKVSLDRRVLYMATNWALFVTGIINLGVGTYYALRGDPTVAATSLTAGLVLLFAATIDRFESIKGLGLEAKTRQLDRKLEEADEALARLTELTELCGAALIDLNSRAGRLVQPPAPRDAYALAQRVKHMMQKGGSTPSAVAKALEPWAWILCQDLAGSVLAPIHKALQKRSVALGRIQSAIPNPVNPTNPEWLQVRAEMRDISEYRETLSKIRAAELDQFPDMLLALLNNVPSVPASEVAAARGKAGHFAPEIHHLRQLMDLRNPELWFAELDAEEPSES